MKTLIFVRHGETELNGDGDRFCGSLDPALSNKGQQEAQRAAEVLERLGLQVDLAMTSPSRRALETARYLLPTATWQISEDLRELSFGDWEGLTKEECQASTPEAYAAWDEDAYSNPPPAGESGIQARSRVERILKSIEAVTARTILLVSHRTYLRLLVGLTVGVPPAEIRRRIDIQTGRIGILELRGRKARLRALNL
ncbi:MAG: histidine phosphatase family protein [Acidobacteriota bacterium]